MKIVIVHPYPVHPGAVGGVTRVFELARFLAPRHAVVILAFQSPDGAAADAQAIADMEQLGVEQRLFPRPEAGVRRKAAWWFDGRAPYHVRRNGSPEIAAALARMAGRTSVDVVHLELGYLAPLVAGLPSGTVRGLAEQETMSLAVERLARVPFLQRTWYERLAPRAAAKIRAFEAATLPAFDCLYGITEGEAARLSEAAGRPVPVLPHVIDVERFAVAPKVAAPALLFVGNFAHHPNRHGLDWFVSRVWAQVRREVPAARLDVVGPGFPPDIAGRLASAGITVRGFVPDLAEAYRQAAVVINPIRSGGGMRGKVLEAFASGRAVVSTSMGMEGIDAADGSHCLVADSAQAFAESVVRYLRSGGLREEHGRRARARVTTQYHAPLVFSRLERDYLAAVERRQSDGARRRA